MTFVRGKRINAKRGGNETTQGVRNRPAVRIAQGTLHTLSHDESVAVATSS